MKNPNTPENIQLNKEIDPKTTAWDTLSDQPFNGGEKPQVTKTSEHTKILKYPDGHIAIQSTYYDLPDKLKEQSSSSPKNPELSSAISSLSFDLSMIDLFQDDFLTSEDETIKHYRGTAFEHLKELRKMAQEGHEKEVDDFLYLAEEMGTAGETLSAMYDVAEIAPDPQDAPIKSEVLKLGEEVDNMISKGKLNLEKIHDLQSRYSMIKGSATNPEIIEAVSARLRQLGMLESQVETINQKIASIGD